MILLTHLINCNPYIDCPRVSQVTQMAIDGQFVPVPALPYSIRPFQKIPSRKTRESGCRIVLKCSLKNLCCLTLLFAIESISLKSQMAR